MTKSSTDTASGGGVSAKHAARSEEPTTSSQRERRRRILDATLALAAKGGYEAVQMRAVAEKAEVAVGTLYRYFPSKVHLLTSALAREFRRLDQRTERSDPPGDARLGFGDDAQQKRRQQQQDGHMNDDIDHNP